MKRSKALGVTLKLRGARFTTALRLAAESCGARLKILECGDCFLYENPDSFIDVRGSGLSAALLTAAKLGGLDLAASVQDAALPSVSARLSGIGWDKSLRTLAALGGFALAEDSPGRFRLTAPGMESLPKENQESILNAWNLKIRQLNIDLIQAGEGQGESGRLLKAWKSLLMEMRAAVLKGPLDAERARLLSMLEALKESVLSTEGEILKVRMKGLAVEMEELLETAGAEASMGCFIRGLDSIATLQELLEEGLHAGRWDEHLQRPFAALLRGVDAALAGDGAKPGLETAARVTRELSRGPIAALPGTAGFLEKLAARANAAKAMIEFNGLGVRLEGVFCSSREKVAILNGRCFREGDAFTLADLGLAGDSGVKMELLEIRPDSPAVVKFKGVGMALRLVQK